VQARLHENDTWVTAKHRVESEIVRHQARPLGDLRQHSRASLVLIVKCKLMIRPQRTREQPIRAALTLNTLANAARTRLALLAGQLLIRNREGTAKSGCGKLTMGDAIGDHFDREALSITYCFFGTWP